MRGRLSEHRPDRYLHNLGSGQITLELRGRCAALHQHVRLRGTAGEWLLDGDDLVVAAVANREVLRVAHDSLVREIIGPRPEAVHTTIRIATPHRCGSRRRYRRPGDDDAERQGHRSRAYRGG